MTAWIPADYAEYMNRFNRRDYAEAFARYEDGCREELRRLESCPELALEAERVMQQADDLTKGLWKKRKLLDLQCFLMFYVSPLLRKAGTEAAGEFAERLKERWLTRHPDRGYPVESYEQIYDGFNDTFLGFRIPAGGKK